MTALPPRVQALLEQAREGDGPQEGDRARVHASLMAAIAAGKPPGTGDGSAPPNASSAGGSAAGAAGSGALLKWGGALLVASAAATAMLAGPWGGEPEAPDAATAVAGAETDDTVAAPGNGAGTATAGAETAEAAETAEPKAVAAEDEAASGDGEDTGEGAAPAGEGDGEAARTARAAENAQARGDGERHPARARARARATRTRQPDDEVSTLQSATAEGDTPTTPAGAEEATQPSTDVEADDAQEAAATGPAASSGRRELTLIQKATRALSAGELNLALAALSEHGREFPRGMLAQERQGLRVLTLCRMGRVAEGQRERARFLASQPDSPMAARVRAACSDASR